MADTHPLLHTWSVWHCPSHGKMKVNHGDHKAVKDVTTCIDSFKTVEELWSIVYSLPSATKMPVNDVLCFFRENIQPFWEDPNLKSGGRIFFKLVPSPDVDKFVVEILSHVVGGFLDQEMVFPDLSAGIRIHRKDVKRDYFIKVELWFVHWEKLSEIRTYVIDLAAQCDIKNIDQCITDDKF